MEQRAGVDAVLRNLARQRRWYGEPLGDRVRRLLVAYAISQGRLADALGVSRPMLSQLMSGRRAAIGNPLVLARMSMLERRVLTPEVAAGEPEALRRALEEVHRAEPVLGPHTADGDVEEALSALRRAALPEELARAADTLGERFPRLAGLLSRAAQQDPAAHQQDPVVTQRTEPDGRSRPSDG